MNKRKFRRLLLGEFSARRIVHSIIFIYIVVCIYAYFFTDNILFQPQPPSYSDTSEILKLKTADGIQISATYLPNPQATYTILYSHGNAEDLGDVIPVLQNIREIGFAVFAYDYHGYGTSQGKPNESNAYLDINAAYDYLTRNLALPSQKIIAYGRSVGGGPALDLASRKSVAGLILESTFITAFRTVTRIPLVPFDRFRNIDKIAHIHFPVLLIHGRSDRTIPFQQGQELFRAANEPKGFFWVDGADHNDVMEVAGTRYGEMLREFSQVVTSANPH
jgi:abhydrolase domain-containing protein 17